MVAVLPRTDVVEQLGVNRSVTVYATAQSDALLAIALLEGVGAAPREQSFHTPLDQSIQDMPNEASGVVSQIGIPHNASHCALHEPEEPCFAIVVCHRHTDEDIPEAVLQKHRDARIIVLSDCSREQTVVDFLDRGARHFFNIRESHRLLRARLTAALRQHRGVFRRPLTIGDIHFDSQKREVRRGGKLVQLSPKEYEFASRVFSNIDQVVSNSELMTSVWSLPPHMDTRRIDTAACRVRKKLRLSSDDGWELKRIRRVGYRLTQVE